MKSDTFLAGSPAGTIRRRSGTALTMLQADVALRLLLLPLAVVATLLFALPALSIAENTISGTVSLPSGRTATEDMYVSVFAQTEDYLVSTSAHIPAGESEGIYTLTVPPSGSTFLRVFYSYLGSEAYLQNGYYSLSGTQWQFDQATLLSGGVDPKDINLTLLTGNTISGTVSLPPGRTATEEMYVSVSAQTENYSVSVSATAYIPAGESEGIYTLTVPPDDSAPLRISYSYCCSEAYLRYGYFSLSGTQWQSDLATLLSGGADHNDIDLTLLTVNTISGTVSLPSGRTATENMYVSVYAWNPEDYSMPVSATAYIPAGESAGIYTLTVPPDGSASWQISYSYCCSEAFLQYGYYSLSGTQWQADQATPLSGGADHNGIDLTLLTVNTISGTVSLPSGRTATEDMPVSVYAQTEDYSVSVSTTAYIPAGESEGKYALALPPDGSASFRISYTYGGSEAYLQNGYYSLSGTQWQSDQATLLSGGSDHNDIDLTLLTGNTISGAVTLPPGRTATEDMYVSVSAQTEDYSVSVATTAYIPAGESAGIYALALPPDGSAPLRISYSYCCSEAYLQNGYYSLAGTQWQADQATFLSGGTDHKDIDLTLQTGNTISGALSLPSGRTATEDMQVSVYAQTEDYSVSVSTTAYIPAGKSEGVYTLKVPPSDNASLLISYTYWGSEPYFPEGYYCTTDTTWQREFASLLPGGTDHSDINLTLLIGNTISGTVFLPQDHAAPAGGFSITLLVTDATSLSGFSTGVLIQEGDSSASYEIHLPPASNDHFYIISYLVGESYLQSGYYSTSGTTWQSDLATLVSGGMDHDDINLTLLIANTISGTVSLPPEHTAPEGGIYVTLDAYNQNASVGGATTSAFIEAGQSSGTYTFLVPPDNNSAWQVSYWYWEGNEAYLHQGYYSSSGTQWQAEQATLLQGGTNHEKIDLTLLTGNTISGTISLPSGHTAPEGGMTVDVYAYDQNSSG
ncbi:MAG: hypothetical protein EOM37_16505, partial [Proteobacteria bacterium]|nr:hypothetical protein [Pseudomonadota bacterium]